MKIPIAILLTILLVSCAKEECTANLEIYANGVPIVVSNPITGLAFNGDRLILELSRGNADLISYLASEADSENPIQLTFFINGLQVSDDVTLVDYGSIDWRFVEIPIIVKRAVLEEHLKSRGPSISGD